MSSSVTLEYAIIMGLPAIPLPPEGHFSDQLTLEDSTSMLYNVGSTLADELAILDSLLLDTGANSGVFTDTMSQSDGFVYDTGAMPFSFNETLIQLDMMAGTLSPVFPSAESFSDSMAQQDSLSYALGATALVINETLLMLDSETIQLVSSALSFTEQLTQSDAAIVVTNLVITTQSLPEAAVNNHYDAQLTASGGLQPYTWSLQEEYAIQTVTGTGRVADWKDSIELATNNAVATSDSLRNYNDSVTLSLDIGNGMVPGLTLSTSGLISGTPTMAGTYNFTVILSDANGDLLRFGIRVEL
jgi:large repetitive protein